MANGSSAWCCSAPAPAATRARDSDYDVAVFLKDLRGFGKEARTIAEIETDILSETGVVINALPSRPALIANGPG